MNFKEVINLNRKFFFKYWCNTNMHIIIYELNIVIFINKCNIYIFFKSKINEILIW